MRINQQLNLVQPIDTDVGRCYMHSIPISRQVFECYTLVIAKTYAMIMSEGLNVVAGPPVAKSLLRDVAVSLGRWDGPTGVEHGLINEVRRLTSVFMPTDAGWNTVPYDQVLTQDIIDEDTLADAEGALIFFTCASAMQRGPMNRWKLTALLGAAESAWRVQTTLLDAMAYARSLPTSTRAAPTPAATSSIPH